MLRPVEGERAVALHVEIARLAGVYGIGPLVQDLQLVAGNGLAARAGSQVVEPVRAVDVQHLGRPDAVEDGEAESFLPAPPDLGGQRLGRGDAVADGREVARFGTLEVEDRVVERRSREKERG